MPRIQSPEKLSLKITLMAASVMMNLGGAVLAPALPAIRTQFGDEANVDYLARLVLTLPAFFIALNAPLAGFIVDRIGRMNVLTVSLLLAGLAGTSGYFATSLTMVLIGRGLLGIAMAGIMTSTTTLIADYYTGEARARFMGLQTGILGIGGTLMLISSGVLADVSWRMPFLIHAAALAVLPFALMFLYEPPQADRCQEDHPPVGEPGTCAGEAVHRGTRASERAPSDEAIPIRLIAFIYAVILVVQVISNIVPIQLPFYLRELSGASATQSGLAISLMSLSFAFASIFLGKAMARRDHISVLMASFVLVGLGYALVSLPSVRVTLYPGLIITGVGLGMLVPNVYVWLANETPVAYRGRTLGGFTMALFLGQFLSPILSQPVIAVYDIGSTILIAGAVLVALVPLIFAGRGRLRTLTAKPVQS